MKKQSSSPAKKLAFCGIFAALTIGILYIAGFTVLDMSALLVCSLITVLIVIETGDQTALVFIAATSVLAYLLLPSKLYATEYFLFAALYPLLKERLERLPKWLALISKYAVLTLMLLGCIVLAQYVLMVGDEFFSLKLVTMILGVAFVILYDFALSRCIFLYLLKLRKVWKIDRFFS